VKDFESKAHELMIQGNRTVYLVTTFHFQN